MPAVAVCTIDQITTGHLCDTTAIIQGALQTDVLIGGLSVAVVGDSIAPHTIEVGEECVFHSAVVNSGSSKVFIAGRAVARIGDSADNGTIVTGSTKVFVGG